MPDLCSETPFTGTATLPGTGRQWGPFGSSLQPPLSSCRYGSPTASFCWSPTLGCQSLQVEKGSQDDSQLLPSRQTCWPAGNDPPSPRNMPPTPHQLQPHQLLQSERKTPVSVFTDVSKLQERHITLQKLSQDSTLISQQHLAGDSCSKRCYSPLLQSTPTSVLFSWILSQMTGERRERRNSQFPKGRALSTPRSFLRGTHFQFF